MSKKIPAGDGNGRSILSDDPLLRRLHGEGIGRDILVFGDLILDCGDKEVLLTHQEAKILELFLRHPAGRVFTRKEIYEYAWGSGHPVGEKAVNVHISNLRKKLKEVCGSDCIETVWGVGFRIM